MYVPGSRPELFDKAQRSGADVVIIDLEDAVHPEDKDQARRTVSTYLEDNAVRAVPVHLRVNAAGTAWAREDLAMAREVAGALGGVRVPKVDSLSTLNDVAELVPDVALYPLLESATGLGIMGEVCRHPNVRSVGLGEVDLRTALGLSAASAFDLIRVQLVIALAAAGKEGMLGSVYAQVRDLEGLRVESLHLRTLGMTGRTVIHPAQIPVVHKAFAPTTAELEWAREVVETLDGPSKVANPGAYVLANGDFVDAPVITRARAILNARHPQFNDEEGATS